MIFIQNIKRSRKNLMKEFNTAFIIDVSSKATEPFVKLSPFYPHGNIPVPFSENVFSYSVEGIWQGLKVFIEKDIDVSKFDVQTMSGLKRPVRFYGKPKGHRKGISGEILDYISARKLIYIPTYQWVLKNKTPDLLELLKEKAKIKDLVLLDYTTNEDLYNLTKPLSHASIIKNELELIMPELKYKQFPNVSAKSDRKTQTNQTKLNFE